MVNGATGSGVTFRGGQGFSVAPVKQFAFQAEKTIRTRRGGRGGARGGGAAPAPEQKPAGPTPEQIKQDAQKKAQADTETLRLRLQRGQITPLQARQGITRIAKETGQSLSRLGIQRVFGGGVGVSQLRGQTAALRQIPKELRQLEARRLSGKISDSETAGGVRRILGLSRDTSVEQALGLIKITPKQILESFSTEQLFGKTPTRRGPGLKIDTRLLDIKGGVPDELIPRGATPRRTTKRLAFGPTEEIGLPGFLGSAERFLPTSETGITPPRSPVGTIFEESIQQTSLGQGTALVQQKIRPPTFSEQLQGVNPGDIKKLKDKASLIQFEVVTGQINESQGNAKLTKVIDDFSKNEILKTVPLNVGIGFTLALISSVVPFVGPVVGSAIATDLFLKRRQFVSQFKNFPVESALATAGFFAGGLVGSGVGAGRPVKIDSSTHQSSTLIKGVEKGRFIKQLENDPNFVKVRSAGKVTDTIVYDVKLADGRSFRIAEFGKLKADPFSPKKSFVTERAFFGTELGKALPEKVFGATVGQIGRESGRGQAFTKVIRFRPLKSTLTGKEFGFDRAKTIELANKFQIFNVGKNKSGIVSQSVLLRMKNANPQLINRIRSIENKVAKGQKININEIKNMVNLERSARGQKPFTEQEFKAGGVPEISGTIINRLLSDAKLSVQQNQKILSSSLTIKAKIFGEAGTFVRIGEGPKKATTPFPVDTPTKTRTAFNIRMIELVKRFRDAKNNLNRVSSKEGATTQQIVKAKREMSSISNQLVNLEQSLPISAGPLSQALSLQIKSNPLVKLDVGTLKFIGGLSPAFRSLLGNELLVETRLEQAQKIKQSLDNQLKLQTDLTQNSTTLTAQSSLQNVKQQNEQATKVIQRLKQIQRLNLRLKLRNVSNRDLRLGNIPRIKKPVKLPPLLLGGPSRRPSTAFGTPESKNQGYHAFAKQRGVNIRLNKVPISKRQALDLSAFVVDNSTSRRGGIIRAFNKSSQKPLTRIPKNYFTRTSKKYRTFKTVQGKRIPLVNQFIERRKFGIDSRGEKRGLSIARVIAKRRKAIPLLSAPKTKKSFKPDGSTLSKNLNKKGRKK